MMYRSICLCAVFVVLLGGVIAAEKVEEPQSLSKEELFSSENIHRISETYGHLIFKSLENPMLQLDFDSVVKGLREAKAGKPSPMTEQEYEEAVSNIQQYMFKEMAEKNLQEAEAFLEKNAKEPGVVELEAGKLQILDLEEGSGEEVTEQTTPVLHYIGKYADGNSFGNSYDSGDPISISLDHTIPGFRQGVLGMKVGGKRRIFVHPDLGYGTSGQLMPNALLIFDIEVVKVEPVEEKSKDDLLLEEDIVEEEFAIEEEDSESENS